MDEQVQDALSLAMSAMMYAAAISLILFALLRLRDLNINVAERIDEKQSVETTKESDISYSYANQTDEELSSEQVLNMILGITDSDIAITVNGHTLSETDLERARKGITTNVKSIKDMLSGTYYMKTIFDTEDGKDFIAEIQFYN